jgi:hypothetical protein
MIVDAIATGLLIATAADKMTLVLGWTASYGVMHHCHGRLTSAASPYSVMCRYAAKRKVNEGVDWKQYFSEFGEEKLRQDDAGAATAAIAVTATATATVTDDRVEYESQTQSLHSDESHVPVPDSFVDAILSDPAPKQLNLPQIEYQQLPGQLDYDTVATTGEMEDMDLQITTDERYMKMAIQMA